MEDKIQEDKNSSNLNPNHPGIKFLKSLYDRCDKGYINLRFLPSAKSLFIPLSKIDSILSFFPSYKNQNVYFGVATHIDGDATKSSIIQIPALFIDIDLDKFSEEEKKDILQRLKDFPLSPSFVINTGGGIHIYWKLKEPASKEEISKVETFLKRLASYFNGDINATDASRILRIPGTLNHKYEPGREVNIKTFNTENEYNLDDFDFLSEIEGTLNQDENAHLPKGWQENLLEEVLEGERNNAITRLAGRYLGKGLSKNEILPILKDANSRFKPPLSHEEVEATLNSIIKTHQRNRSERPIEKTDQRERLSWPSPLAEQAFHGLAGEFVKVIEPQTEADPVALLIQFLMAVGNIIGPTAHFKVESDIHYLKLFPILVGETSKARKGTSTGYIKKFFKQIDPEWKIKSGLSTGEGLIWAVHDEIKKRDPIKIKGKFTGEYDEYISDPGVEDKRLVIIEEEFASILRLIRREGNILSPIIRRTWDDGNLESMSKNSPAKATGAHISIHGHITCDELKRELDRTEIGNGFANRFIWLCVRRSKELPEGGQLDGLNLESVSTRLKEVIEFGRNINEIKKDGETMRIWAGIYPGLSAGKPGLFGAVISRAEAQVMRIACIYAVLDRSLWIRKEHLLAALSIWNYSEASARYIFGDATGDPIADRILQALRDFPNGLARTGMSDLFSRNIDREKIGLALSFLESHGLIRMIKKETGGRPMELWTVV